MEQISSLERRASGWTTLPCIRRSAPNWTTVAFRTHTKVTNLSQQLSAFVREHHFGRHLLTASVPFLCCTFYYYTYTFILYIYNIVIRQCYALYVSQPELYHGLVKYFRGQVKYLMQASYVTTSSWQTLLYTARCHTCYISLVPLYLFLPQLIFAPFLPGLFYSGFKFWV